MQWVPPCAALWAAVLPLSFDAHVGAVGACLDLKDVHAVAHCRAGSVSELCMDWEAALGVLQGLHESVRARAMSCHRECPCRTFCEAFVRADLGCTFDLGGDLGRFGSV